MMCCSVPKTAKPVVVNVELIRRKVVPTNSLTLVKEKRLNREVDLTQPVKWIHEWECPQKWMNLYQVMMLSIIHYRPLKKHLWVVCHEREKYFNLT